jgi:hypothetical protein
MSEESWPELHKQQMLFGTYSMNNFFIWAESCVDLEPKGGAPVPFAIAVHAHEYIHFLHNISTASGAAIFIARLWLLRSMAICADNTGYSMGDAEFTEEQKKMALASHTLMEAVLGVSPWKGGEGARHKPVRWEFKEVVRNQLNVEMPPTEISIEVAKIEGVAVDQENYEHEFSLHMGYYFITEGIAYEVEREIRQKNGEMSWDIDRDTPAFPYLAYQPLVDHLLGRPSTARERIFIGVMALQHSSPSVGLVDFCDDFRNRLFDESMLNEKSGALGEDRCSWLARQIDTEIEAAKGSGNGVWGGEDVQALFNEGFKLRGIFGMLEFAFLHDSLDLKRFRELQGAMVDCCVIQEKPDGHSEIFWIGPGAVAKDDQEGARICSFQAALHFAGLHIRKGGKLVATSELPDKKCPFSGACEQEKIDGMPDDCKKKPWRRFHGVPIEQPTCWYAAGVRRFIRKRGEAGTETETEEIK